MKKMIICFVIVSLFGISYAKASKKKGAGDFPRTNCKILVSNPETGRKIASKSKKNHDKVYYVHAASKKECAQTAKWYEHMYSTVTGSDEPAEFEFISK